MSTWLVPDHLALLIHDRNNTWQDNYIGNEARHVNNIRISWAQNKQNNCKNVMSDYHYKHYYYVC